jgi:hypothetical protein
MTGAIALSVLVQLGFRWFYYHDVLPNTAYAKVAFGTARLMAGWEHLTKSAGPLCGSWFLLLLSVLHALFYPKSQDSPLGPKSRGIGLGLAILGVGWAAYVLFVGGDTFPAWRQLGYVVLFGALAGSWLLERGLHGTSAFTASLHFALALILLTFVTTAYDEGNWAKRERWQWDGRSVGRAFRKAWTDERPRIAVDAAGAIPYYSGLPTLDMLGLTDRYLAHHPPTDLAERTMGHGLGDADYYLERAPDVFCFGIPPCRFGAKYRPQKEMVKRVAFSENYTRATILLDEKAAKGGELRSEIWVRREGRVGIVRAKDVVFVPALLFSDKDAPARPDGGAFRVSSKKKQTLFFEDLPLSKGDWKVRFTGAEGKARVRLRNSGGRPARGSTAEDLNLELREAGRLDVRLSARPGFSFLGLEIRRRGKEGN